MRRSHLLVLTALVLSASLLPAQMAGGASQGGGSQGGGSHSGGSHGAGVSGAGGRMPGHGTRPGPTNGFFPRLSGDHHQRGTGAVWLPYGAPYWDEYGNFWDEPYDQQPADYQQPAPPTSPQVIMVQNQPLPPPAAPPQPPKLIEVPQTKEAPAAKPQPPTLFVLKGGERLESRNYLLTAESLQIQIGRRWRQIPLDTLNLDATIAANRARGIELTIPRDRTAMFVSF